jgi:hypothetical protein
MPLNHSSYLSITFTGTRAHMQRLYALLRVVPYSREVEAGEPSSCAKCAATGVDLIPCPTCYQTSVCASGDCVDSEHHGEWCLIGKEMALFRRKHILRPEPLPDPNNEHDPDWEFSKEEWQKIGKTLDGTTFLGFPPPAERQDGAAPRRKSPRLDSGLSATREVAAAINKVAKYLNLVRRYHLGDDYDDCYPFEYLPTASTNGKFAKRAPRRQPIAQRYLPALEHGLTREQHRAIVLVAMVANLDNPPDYTMSCYTSRASVIEPTKFRFLLKWRKVPHHFFVMDVRAFFPKLQVVSAFMDFGNTVVCETFADGAEQYSSWVGYVEHSVAGEESTQTFHGPIKALVERHGFDDEEWSWG